MELGLALVFRHLSCTTGLTKLITAKPVFKGHLHIPDKRHTGQVSIHCRFLNMGRPPFRANCPLSEGLLSLVSPFKTGFTVHIIWLFIL